MLAPILQVSPAQILRRCNQPNQFDYLAKGVSQDVNDKLQALGLSGIGTIPSEESVYDPSPVPGDCRSPRTCSASSTPTGSASTGWRGTTTPSSRASTATSSTLTDVNGNAIVLGRQQKVPAKNGDNLELGLDPQIQYGAEVALANGVNCRTRSPARS